MENPYVVTVFKVEKPEYEHSTLVYIYAPYNSYMVSSREEAYKLLKRWGFVHRWNWPPYISWYKWDGNNQRTHVATVTEVLNDFPENCFDEARSERFLIEGHIEQRR